MDHPTRHRRHASRGAAVARVSVVVGLAAAAGFVISGDWHGAPMWLSTPALVDCSAANISPAPYPAL
jgi:hypothetical protein